MIIPKEHRNNVIWSAFFTILFFLFTCAFAPNPVSNTERAIQYQSLADLHSQVTAINDAQQFSYRPNIKPVFIDPDFKPFNEVSKIVADNRSVLQRIVFLQKAGLSIKPVLAHRLFYRYHSIDTDDPPFLG